MSDERPDKPTRKSGRGAGGANGGGMRFGRGVFGWVLFIGLAVMLFMLVNHTRSTQERIDLGTFWNELAKGGVKDLTMGGDDVYGVFNDPAKVQLPTTGREVISFRTPFPQGNTADWQFTKAIIDTVNKQGVPAT